MIRSTQRPSQYTIRPFRSGDRDAFLSLYETVFGHERSEDWFRWKFQANPYADHVPIVVVERAGEIVGCRSFFAQNVRYNGDVWDAFQPCDTMVHPDHRRQGLFSRMNELALERYADREPALCFNFPNESSKPGNLKHGWREVGTIPMYYRPEDPGRALQAVTTGGADGSRDNGGADSGERIGSGDGIGTDGGIGGSDGSAAGVTNALSRALGTAVPGAHSTGDRLLAPSEAAVTVERHETPPAETLAAIYRRSIPDGIHTNRTAAFYRWRLDNPEQTYATYVATRDGDPIAALVVSPVESPTGDHLRIVETLPRSIDVAADELEVLLVRALADYEAQCFVTAFGKTLPRPLRYRFYPDTRFPLSTLLQPACRTILARDLGEETGIERSTADDWCLSRLDLDTT